MARRRIGAVGGVLAALMAVGGLTAVPAASSTTESEATAAAASGQADIETHRSLFEGRIVELLNDDRVRMGLRPLQRVQEVDMTARNWSGRMATERRLRHNPSYRTELPSGWRATAENVAAGQKTPDEMYRAWYDSPADYRNMFNPDFTHVGVGVVHSSGPGQPTPYGSQLFATYPSGKRLEPTPAYPYTAQIDIPHDDGSSTADIDDGGVGGDGNVYHLNTRWGGDADIVFPYGNAGGRAYVGDWDGDGIDTLAYRIGSTFYFKMSNSSGKANHVVSYGRPGDRVYVGDWNGDGVDTLAIRRGKTYHIKNSLETGEADRLVHYGRATDEVLVGDWNGDATDTLAVRRGSVYHFRNTMAGGPADDVVNYGRAGDDVYVGDWNTDLMDTLAVRRGKTYHIKNAIRGGDADRVVLYGREDDTTLVGSWECCLQDTLGIRR